MDTYLEDISKINWCIKLAEQKLLSRKVLGSSQYWTFLYSEHKENILTASITRLQARRAKIIIQLYKQFVTKTEIG